MKVKIEKLRALTPELVSKLSDFSAEEVRAADKILLKRSRAWLFTAQGEPVVVVGIFPTSLVGTSIEVWILLFQSTHRREMIRVLRRGMHLLLNHFGQIQVRTEDGTRNERLVRFLGLRYVFTGRGGDGKLYQMYEARKSWAR